MACAGTALRIKRRYAVGVLPRSGGGAEYVRELEASARQRGVEPLGFILGHASGADGSHIIAPDPEGHGLEHTMRLAMHNAGVNGADIDFISAHGTGTPSNDRVESLVFKRVLGSRAYAIPINSIKAHMGHTMGAAAILETIMCLLAGRYGQVPPTLNYGEPDPDCDLDYVPNEVRKARVRAAMSNSFGFGGTNASLLFKAYKP